MSNTTTLWEIDKEATIAAFTDLLIFGPFSAAESRSWAEDLFAEIQGRERTFRQLRLPLDSRSDQEDIDIYDSGGPVWVEVSDVE